MEFDWTQGGLAEGLRRYNAGEYFTAHEAWETIWLEAQEPDRTFLQGLIQVTAAFHHLRRNNPVGTSRLLHAALRRLELYPACFGGISVTTLCSDIRSGYKHFKRMNQRPNFLGPGYYPLSEPSS
jgi:predicted metal-dependent hydrolase